MIFTKVKNNNNSFFNINILTSYEINVRDFISELPRAVRKAVHLNLYAKCENNNTFIGFHPETVKSWVKNGKLTEADVAGVKYAGELRKLRYSPAIINDIVKSANENGYLVSLNHPAWSLINFNDYTNYDGIWAVEIYNSECKALGWCDDEHVYGEMLQYGKQIFGIATHAKPN